MRLLPHQSALVAAFVTACLGAVVPPLQKLFLPVVYLNTHVHELCHAIVALACGGQVDRILVFASGSGVTPILGGNVFLEASAGYVGASIVGAMMLFFSRSPRSAKNTLRTLAGFLTVSMIVFVRGDMVGVVSGVCWVIALIAITQYVTGYGIMFAAQLLGLLQCLNAVQSLYVLLQISAFTEGNSDARIVAQATGIDSIVWAVGWCVFSLIVMAITVHRAWTSPLGTPPARPPV